MFKKELEGRSILDVGCGSGDFLMCVDANLPHKKLVGIDTSPVVIPDRVKNIDFICGDIINFNLDQKFDVVFSDNVLEHIAPVDLPCHLSSIRRALSDDGVLILIMPNRLFGPSDVTRIIDLSYSNKIEAMGTHLNESTHTEMMRVLEDSGFGPFKTVFPLPIIRYYLNSVRISPDYLVWIENNRIALNAFYKVRLLSLLFSNLYIYTVASVKRNTFA